MVGVVTSDKMDKTVVVEVERLVRHERYEKTLRLRRRFLGTAKEWLTEKLQKAKKFPPHQELLLKHHFNLLCVEEKFVQELIDMMKDSKAA